MPPPIEIGRKQGACLAHRPEPRSGRAVHRHNRAVRLGGLRLPIAIGRNRRRPAELVETAPAEFQHVPRPCNERPRERIARGVRLRSPTSLRLCVEWCHPMNPSRLEASDKTAHDSSGAFASAPKPEPQRGGPAPNLDARSQVHLQQKLKSVHRNLCAALLRQIAQDCRIQESVFLTLSSARAGS